MRRLLAVLALLVVSGCGDEEESGIVVSGLNPCATRGATYLVHYSEVSGNCGYLPDEILNTSPDGSTVSITCDEVTQTGCTARDTNCRMSSGGCNQTFTFETTFTKDGSSASGIMTISLDCSDGSGCKSTYTYTYDRQ